MLSFCFKDCSILMANQIIDRKTLSFNLHIARMIKISSVCLNQQYSGRRQQIKEGSTRKTANCRKHTHQVLLHRPFLFHHWRRGCMFGSLQETLVQMNLNNENRQSKKRRRNSWLFYHLKKKVLFIPIQTSFREIRRCHGGSR